MSKIPNPSGSDTLQQSQLVQLSGQVDLAFVVDNTGSMSSAIDMVKHEIQALAQQVSQLGRVRRLRLAYVACADFADRLPVQTFAFTDSLPAFHSFVSSLQLQYGFDAAEDVFSGLEAAGKLAWQAGTRVLVHICDAPAHGTAYHDGVNDDYPSGDLLGRQAKQLLSTLAADCCLDQYLVCHLNSTTHRMTARFQEELGLQFQGFVQDYTGPLSSIPAKVVATTVSSFSGSRVTGGAGKYSFLPLRVVIGEPEWSTISPRDATVYFYSAATTAGADTEMILDAITTFKRYILPEVANRRASVRIAPSPFSAEGRAKWPFWADVDAAGASSGPKLAHKLVAKRLKTPIGVASAEAEFHTLDRYVSELESSLVAAVLADDFTLSLLAADLPGNVSYAPVYMMAEDRGLATSHFHMLEPRLEGDWTRFSNNAGYVNPEAEAELVLAFLHWTWEASNEQLMVTDLQGVRTGKDTYTLTDPAVHCPADMNRFTRTNFGAAGFDAFFSSHTCGPTCKALGLGPGPSVSNSAGKPQPTVAASKQTTTLLMPILEE